MSITYAGTTYEVVKEADGAFAVRVSTTGKLPELVQGFATIEEAENWILIQAERPFGDQGLPRHI